MTTDPNYKKLCETDKLIAGHIFENAYLTNKLSGQTTYLGDFYGEPDCALISTNNDWCIIAGSTFILWTEKEIIEIKDKNICPAYALRHNTNNKVEILTDPWKSNASVWEFDVQTKQRRKIKDFDQYNDKAYTENVEW